MEGIRLSEMDEINEFPSSGKVYGIAAGYNSGAFTKAAFLDLVYKSAAGLNKFTTAVEPTRVGNVITFPADIGWLLQGIAYTNTLNNVVTVPYAASGKSRIDLIVANSSNQFVRVPGVEVTDPAAPAAPIVPTNTLLASTVLVGDDSVGIVSDPQSPVYVGMYSSDEDFIAAVPRAYFGYFGYIINENQSLLALYDGTEWSYVDLIPQNLTSVVEQGELLHNQISISSGTSYTFQLSDRLKDNVLDTTVKAVVLNDTAFPVHSVIRFQTYTGCLFTSSNDISFNGGTGNSVWIAPGEKCELKKINELSGVKYWILNKSSIAHQDFEVQLTQTGTSHPAIVSGSLKGNRLSTITVVRITDGDYEIQSSLPIFANAKDCFKDYLTPIIHTFGDLSVGSYSAYSYYVVDDNTVSVKTCLDLFTGGLSDDVLQFAKQIKIEYKH